MDERNDKARLGLVLTQLGQKFLQRTRAEAIALRDMIEQACLGDASVIDQLERLAHKIHGTGTTFGFSAVSEHAGEIERLSEGLKARNASAGTVLEPNIQQRLIECTEQLAQEVEAAAARLCLPQRKIANYGDD